MDILIAIFIAFLWGISPLVQKKLLTNISYKTLMVVSGVFYIIFLAMFTIYNWKDIKNNHKALTTKNIAIIGVVVFFSIFLANILYLLVLKNNAASIMSALVFSAPFFTLICGWLFFKEKIDFWALCGIVLIVIGVVLIAK